MNEIEKTCENCMYEMESEDGLHCRNCIHNTMIQENFEPNVCEWRIDGVYLISPHKIPFTTSLLEPEEYKYKYCPVCGKKIKVVE